MPRTWPALLALGAAAAPALAQVALRGGQRVDSPVLSVSAAGVAVRDGEAQTVIGWERVRRVEGEHAADAAAFAELADLAWRAQARLARGDIALAEPALEALFARRLPGATGYAIAEATLRCRLTRGASLTAIPAWLETLRLRADRQRGSHSDSLDPDTGLCPALPPIWLDTPATAALASDEGLALPPDAPEEARVIAALYRAAAANSHSADLDKAASQARNAATVLIRDLVLAQRGAPEQRAKARERLNADPERDAGTWKEAWRRAAVGRSLLLEPDAADRRRGVLELLHLPARFGPSQPELSALALALCAGELRDQGDTAASDALRRELTLTAPGNPAQAWLDARPAARASQGPSDTGAAR